MLLRVHAVELATPLEHQGDLLGDLTSRRAKITQVENRVLGAEISAEVPLRELWGYANAIVFPGSFSPDRQEIEDQPRLASRASPSWTSIFSSV